MSLMQILMRRAVWTTVSCLVVALGLAMWRAQLDTDREARGSAQVAQLVAALSAMQRVPDDELGVYVRSLQGLDAEGSLRHLRLRILDAQGRELVALPQEAVRAAGSYAWLHPFGTVPDWRMQWTIPRAQGLPLTGILTANPGSELEEALSGVLGLLAILFALAGALLLGIFLAVRRALRPMHDILDTIGYLEAGDTARRLPALSCSELDRIGGALNHLAASLDAAEASRRQLGARIQTLQEDERAQIARDLHDEFGQQVTGMRASAHWLQRRLQDQPQLQAVAQELDREFERMQHGMRQLLQRLRPQEGRGGPAAGDLQDWLRSLLDGWHANAGNDVAIELVFEVDGPRVPQELAVALYRMTQEALTNIARHARARRAQVRVWRQGDTLCWQVADDGVGLQAPEQAMLRGRGLAGLRERVWAQGGELSVHTPAAGGTELRARFARALLREAA